MSNLVDDPVNRSGPGLDVLPEFAEFSGRERRLARDLVEVIHRPAVDPEVAGPACEPLKGLDDRLFVPLEIAVELGPFIEQGDLEPVLLGRSHDASFHVQVPALP